MDTITPFAGPHDDLALHAFVSRIAIQRWPTVVTLPGDLDWWRRADLDDTMRQSIRLWRRNGVLVAMLWHTDDFVDVVYDDTLPDLWNTIVHHVRTHYPPGTQLWTIGAPRSVYQVLQAHGFVQHPSRFKLHVQDPHFAPPVDIPAGIRCMPLQTQHVESRAAAQRSAFQSTKMTTEIYHHVRTLPNYTAQWDMIAVNDAEEVVAFATVWYDTASGIATFEPVGCHQSYQRRGITKALICHTLQRLAAAGVTRARVLSVADSTHPSLALYHACGFTTIAEYGPWQPEQ